MRKVLITTVPFGAKNRLPLEQLQAAGVDYLINPLGRKLTEEELAGMIGDFDVVIAGTEPITARIMANAPRLGLISRVGVGLDSVDLLAAKRLGIQVCYTAEAPAPAVAELSMGLILALLRFTHLANAQMHRGQWQRHFGRRLSAVTVGIIGAGRIGGRVLRQLAALGTHRLLVNDLIPWQQPVPGLELEWVDKETIYHEADVITVHVPLTAQTRNLIGREQLMMMKRDAALINTARGGIVNEAELAAVLAEGHLAGAAIDVFEQEPYSGDLAGIDRCILTSHMGSMSVDCRSQMEIEATEEALRFLAGEPLQGMVPADEYEIQGQGI